VIVRKTFSLLHLALSAICVLSLFGVPAHGQGKGNGKGNGETIEHPNGVIQDWSHRHAVYPRVGPIQSLIAVQNNPRAIQSWQAAARANWHRTNNPKSHNGTQTGIHRDWSISLGLGSTAPFMYPAKFGFDVNLAPDCTNDFVVYPVNVAGSATQPNIVGFNNLYSGPPAGVTGGICNAPNNGRVAGANDDGVSATTMWSYNIHAAGGVVATSPALSIDGKKVAFVETKSTDAAHFHVLAWKSGDGVDITTPNAQNVLSPKSINSGAIEIVTLAPVAGSGTVTDLRLGTGTDDDTLSSPYIEYGQDTAYVGNDAGTLFRIKNVFCTFPQCTGAGSPAPSLDTTWPTTGLTAFTGSLSTGCSGKLTGPVVDGSTGNVFVGCPDGKLYGFTSAGTALTNSPLTVGDGTATGGIVDPPLVDGVNGFVYVVSGSSGVSGPAVLVQAKTDLSSPRVAPVGIGGSFNLHAPSFNDLYFSSPTPTDGLLYTFALDSLGTHVTEYGASFDINRNLNTTPSSNVFPIAAFEVNPTTEFKSGGEDRLFESLRGNISSNFVSFNLTTFATAASPEAFTQIGTLGTSGIVVDNNANTTTFPQAASVYFSNLSGNAAVKMTQLALQ
jgi:hypothetical protein